jgi:ABC-type glycerol-3-phosphate transport system permease component
VTWLLRRGWKYAAMLAVSAFALFPVYWVAITSLKPRSEIYTRTPDLWPSRSGTRTRECSARAMSAARC